MPPGYRQGGKGGVKKKTKGKMVGADSLQEPTKPKKKEQNPLTKKKVWEGGDPIKTPRNVEEKTKLKGGSFLWGGPRNGGRGNKLGPER